MLQSIFTGFAVREMAFDLFGATRDSQHCSIVLSFQNSLLLTGFAAEVCERWTIRCDSGLLDDLVIKPQVEYYAHILHMFSLWHFFPSTCLAVLHCLLVPRSSIFLRHSFIFFIFTVHLPLIFRSYSWIENLDHTLPLNSIPCISYPHIHFIPH